MGAWTTIKGATSAWYVLEDDRYHLFEPDADLLHFAVFVADVATRRPRAPAHAASKRLQELVRQVSWFALLEPAALVLERPLELHVDAAGRPQGSHGPAVRFRTCVYEHDGVCLRARPVGEAQVSAC